MSQLDQKRELLVQLNQMKENPGWVEYQKFFEAQIRHRQAEMIKSPAEIPLGMRDFLAGEIGALTLASRWLDALIEGTQEDINLLIDEENQDARTDTDSQFQSDAHLQRGFNFDDASDDPGGQPRDRI